MGCFELTESQTRALVRMSDHSDGYLPPSPAEMAIVSFRARDGAKIELVIDKGLPDRILIIHAG